MDFALPALLLFDTRGDAERKRAERALTSDAVEKRLYCARCRHRVTDQDERIALQGANEHCCTNPYGLTFRVGCFRRAPGCRPIGTPTLEHTWFKGYAWRIALCARCEAHLGWAFSSSTDGFCALIVDRLSSGGPTDG